MASGLSDGKDLEFGKAGLDSGRLGLSLGAGQEASQNKQPVRMKEETTYNFAKTVRFEEWARPVARLREARCLDKGITVANIACC